MLHGAWPVLESISGVGEGRPLSLLAGTVKIIIMGSTLLICMNVSKKYFMNDVLETCLGTLWLSASSIRPALYANDITLFVEDKALVTVTDGLGSIKPCIVTLIDIFCAIIVMCVKSRTRKTLKTCLMENK